MIRHCLAILLVVLYVSTNEASVLGRLPAFKVKRAAYNGVRNPPLDHGKGIPDYEPGLQFGNQPGHQHGHQPGHQSGYQPGHQPGLQPGHQHGHQPGYNPGHQSGFQPGHQHGNQPGFQPGHQPGFQPGHQPGHRPGHQPGHEFGVRPLQPGHGGSPGVIGGGNYGRPHDHGREFGVNKGSQPGGYGGVKGYAHEHRYRRSPHHNPAHGEPGHVHDPGHGEPGHVHDPGHGEPGHVHDPGHGEPGHVHDPGHGEPGHVHKHVHGPNHSSNESKSSEETQV